MSTLATDSIVLPLDIDQTRRLNEALSGLSAAQLQWASGYVAGLAAANVAPAHGSERTATPAQRLTILFGSQTGNGRGVAELLAERARARGVAVRLLSLADYKPADLKRETRLSLVVSTHGEGDPPDDAELFHEFLLGDRAPKLPNLKFSVLALGDSSYVNFCQTGREVDARLSELGAERAAPLVECDVDYEDGAAHWSDALLETLPVAASPGKPVPHLRAVHATPVAQYDKRRPFAAEVLVNQKITGSHSSKDVRHIEFSLEDSGLHYEPGDALAVIVENPPELVSHLISMLSFDADSFVDLRGEQMTLVEALQTKLEITAASLGFVRAWAGFSASQELAGLLEDGQQEALGAFLDSHQIIDIVKKYPANVDVPAFVASLRKLTPRSYSIASSQLANPDEVHLTVAAVRYNAFGSKHWGAASTHLSDRIRDGDKVLVYVEPNPRFRLPANDATPVIMIGPGTGIAPFRAFVEERAERNAKGGNWLFFGDRTFSNDFLYQLEWQRHLKQGHLQRLDVAFSRDQQEKVYVQQRIREQGAELYRWIEDGAAIYVCGDAKHMAGDVHDALSDVIATHAAVSRDEAESRLKELRRAGRYQRDVY